VALRAATESAVLLVNEGDLLPLRRESLKRLAVLGPNAERTSIQGGGSARVLPHYAVSVLQALGEKAEGHFELVHEAGCTSHKTIPVVEPANLESGVEGQPGFAAEFFGNVGLEGEAAFARVARSMDHTWFGAFDPRVEHASFSARFSARFRAATSGRHTFALTSAGRSRLLVDGELAIDNWTDPVRGEAWYGTGSREERVEVELEEGRPVELVVEYTRDGAPLMGGLKLGHLPPVPPDMMERAVDAAAAADVAVVVVGLNREWETEGHDKEHMRLPGRQAELIERVAAANPKTVVVLNAGTPTDMSWIEGVPAVLQAWYGGQEAGRAVADLLFGDANPSGCLPTTFPVALEDNPAHTGNPLQYPGQDGRVAYLEELHLGYRHYDARGIAPRFAFGHGLSYTCFALEGLRLNGDAFGLDDPIEATTTVRNEGGVAGAEVVQLYLRPPGARLARPTRALCAFCKVALEPGEARQVTLELDRRSLSFWNPETHAWEVEPGEHVVELGSSSRDIRATARFTVDGS
jgi:beta-glucosidase